MCCSKSFIKRLIPFFLTFALGLFVASFFVSVAAPRFRFAFDRDGFRRHEEYHHRLEFENQRLREQKALLEQQLADKSDSTDSTLDEVEINVPAPPLPPMPPPAPVKNFRK